MVLTIAAGVALGVLAAAAVMLPAIRWGPEMLRAAGDLAKRHWPKAALVVFWGVIVVVACAVALIRADRAAARVLSPGLKQAWAGASSAATDVSLYGAAFRQANMVASWFSSLSAVSYTGPLDPTHDPFKLIRGTDVEAFWESFVTSRNETDTRATMRRLRMGPIADGKKLQGAGEQALWALFAAALLDVPTLLLGVLGFWGAALLARMPTAAHAKA